MTGVQKSLLEFCGHSHMDLYIFNYDVRKKHPGKKSKFVLFKEQDKRLVCTVQRTETKKTKMDSGIIA